MASWPSDWITRALAAGGIEPTGNAIAIMRAWKNSTPLPPLTNNPLGFPAGTRGAPAYLGTRYAIFPSMVAFYAAFGSLAKSGLGRELAAALASERGYAPAWRAISALAWPAKDTETDWPAAVLDLTTADYRQSVKAAAPSARRTSGTIGPTSEEATSALDLMRELHSTVANARNGLEATRALIVRGKSYG